MINVPIQGMGGVFTGLIILSLCLYIIGKIYPYIQNRISRPRTSAPAPPGKGENPPAGPDGSPVGPDIVAAIAVALSQVIGASAQVFNLQSAGGEGASTGDASPWRLSGRLSQIQRLPKLSKKPKQ